jgi:hypothetical protein
MDHYSRCPDGFPCFQGEEMQGSFIIPIHFNFHWHALFSDEDT